MVKSPLKTGYNNQKKLTKKGAYVKHISDSLWSELEKIIPHKECAVGRPEFDNRKALNGIIYVPYTGVQWNMLPEKYGLFFKAF